MTMVFAGIMLGGHPGVTHAHPIGHDVSQVGGAYYAPGLRAAPPREPGPPPNPGRGAKGQSEASADRRDAPPPGPPPGRRANGHMSPEDRRLLRQHIEDAVRELYRH
ncbi:hypothetical protein PTE30175_05323 [Pandoraea terrae]|uniref:Uncharacterized protein n=1 Tax=Pandoraea terrae TaxID=1537710 RepID=A0A5E4ZDD0_9BURK|nr:hypothetical protein [Pandoraea terrae]VVE58878.1 hypothetical protein PTE30175_05323 [Pandoraea terrae]